MLRIGACLCRIVFVSAGILRTMPTRWNLSKYRVRDNSYASLVSYPAAPLPLPSWHIHLLASLGFSPFATSSWWEYLPQILVVAVAVELTLLTLVLIAVPCLVQLAPYALSALSIQSYWAD